MFTYIRYSGVQQDKTVGYVNKYKIQWNSTRNNSSISYSGVQLEITLL